MRIGGDSSGLRREINNSQRQMRRAFGPDALAASETAAGVLAGLAVAIGAVGVASVKMAADFAANKTAFTTLLGSAEKAQSLLTDLATFAADTPFELPGLVMGAKKLLAFQFAAEDIIPIMSAVGDAISLVGGGQEAIDGVIRALGQISAKGKLSAEEMNQLSERGINGWKYIADAMGISTAEVMALSQEGAIDATTAINAVVTGMQKNFAGGMEGMAKTVPGLLSTIKDNVGAVMREIGDKITVGLDLQGVLQKTADYLNTFASVVQGGGIKQAILGLIPPEATAAVFALSGALIAVAIPAIYMFGLSVWAATAPLLPFIAAGVAVGLLAYEIWKNWEPLSNLFSTLCDSIYSVFVAYWDMIVDVYSGAWGAITGIIDNNIGWAISAISNAWNSVGEITDSVWSGITGVIDSAWQGIKDIVASGVNWIVSKMQPLLDLVGAAIPSGLANFFNSVSNGLDRVKKASAGISLGFSNKDISDVLPISKPKPNTTFTGLHGNNSSSPAGKGSDKEAKAAEKAEKAAEKAWEQLQKKAEQTSESIKKEWIQLTGTQIDALNNWKADELKTLDESAAANENYQRDLSRLNEIYAAKKKKILADEQKDTNRIWDSAKADAEEYQNKLAEIGVTGVDKQKLDIDQGSSAEIDKMINKYRDLKAEYENGTKEQQEQFRNAWVASGIQFEITENGMLNFQKQIAANQIIIEKEKQQKIQDLHYDTQKFIDNLGKAKDVGNISDYIAELNSERAALSQDLAGRQELIDAYYSTWKETHRTSMSYMAEGMTSFQSGMADLFQDIGKNITSAGDLFKSFGSMVGNILIKMQAQAAAASITSGLFGGLFSGGISGGVSGLEGRGANVRNSTMSSLSMIPKNLFAFAGGGQIFGAGTGTSDSILAMVSNGEYVVQDSAVKEFGVGFFDMLNAGKMPAFATGGIVTGSSLSSVSGNYSNTSVGGSKSASEAPNMRVIINNYGSANVQTEDPRYDSQSKSWVLNVLIDGLKNNSSVRSAAKGATR